MHNPEPKVVFSIHGQIGVSKDVITTGDGRTIQVLRVCIGSASATLDSYEALRLKCALENWINGE